MMQITIDVEEFVDKLPYMIRQQVGEGFYGDIPIELMIAEPAGIFVKAGGRSFLVDMNDICRAIVDQIIME
jgi:hypothetical protein